MNKCIAIILMVISVSCLSIYAQDAQDNIGNVNNKNETDENTATNDKMKVKDEDGNILMEVTDEGNGGSIYLKPNPLISSPADKLYNIGSTLYWNGSAIGTAGSAGGWTDDGSVVRLSLSTDKVGIGTTSPSSLLSVGGNGNNFAIISAVAADYQVGLYSIASGTASTGIYGESAEGNAIEGYTAGNSRGGYFSAGGSSGIGVFGEAPITGWAGWFAGRGYFSDNVGIGSTTPSDKLSINQNTDAFVGISISNTNTSSNSSEGIYFNNEDGSIAGIRLYDDDHIFSSQMRVFNNRTNGSIHFFSENGKLVLDKTGNLSVYSGDILTQGTNSFHTGGDEAALFLGDNFNHIKAVHGFGIKIGVFGVVNSAISIKAGSGNVGIGTESPNSKLSIVGLSEYADNAAALSAGLTEGDLYRTGDILKIVH